MRNSSYEVSAELYGSGVICHGGYRAGRSRPGVAASCKHVEAAECQSLVSHMQLVNSP